MASREENENSYRDHLRRLMKAGPLSEDDRVALDNDRMALRISYVRAKELEEEIAAEIPREGGEQKSTSNPDALVSGGGEENRDVTDQISTTIIPPPDAAKYLEHLKEYEQAFLEALRTENFYPSEETRERLQKLAKQFELSATDVRNIEKKILADLYLTGPLPSPPLASPPPPPVVTKIDPQLELQLEEIAGSLKLGKFKEADLQTFQLLLKMIHSAHLNQPEQRWLDDQALRKFIPKDSQKEVIQRVDQHWQDASGGKFGFSPQLQIYGDNVITQEADLDREQRSNRAYALAFSKQVAWWIKGLEFLKYYNQLTFSTDAPSGHLPARWFWGIPHQENLIRGGLRLVPERGGCGMDAFAIPAFMYMLRKSGF